MRVRWFVLALCGVAASGPLWPKQQRSNIVDVQVSRPPFVEERPAFINYGSSDVVGVNSADLRKTIVRSSFLVSGIRNSDKFLCARIVRSNGSYRANFAIPNPQRGSTIRLLLPSRIISNLHALGAEMAIDVRATDTNCTESGSILATSWTTRPTAEIALLVNSQQATRTTVQVGRAAASICQPLEEFLNDTTIRGTAFNTICHVNLTGSCLEERLVSVRRMDGPIVRRGKATLTIRTPCVV